MKRQQFEFVERNVHGAWIVFGEIGFRQYYGYTKRQAIQRYKDECGKNPVFKSV